MAEWGASLRHCVLGQKQSVQCGAAFRKWQPAREIRLRLACLEYRAAHRHRVEARANPFLAGHLRNFQQATQPIPVRIKMTRQMTS